MGFQVPSPHVPYLQARGLLLEVRAPWDKHLLFTGEERPVGGRPGDLVGLLVPSGPRRGQLELAPCPSSPALSHLWGDILVSGGADHCLGAFLGT